jgi:hypothetical protein
LSKGNEHWGQKSPSAIYFPKGVAKVFIVVLGTTELTPQSPGFTVTATKPSTDVRSACKETYGTPAVENRGKAAPQFSRGQLGNAAILRPFVTVIFDSTITELRESNESNGSNHHQ